MFGGGDVAEHDCGARLRLHHARHVSHPARRRFAVVIRADDDLAGSQAQALIQRGTLSLCARTHVFQPSISSELRERVFGRAPLTLVHDNQVERSVPGFKQRADCAKQRIRTIAR